MIYLILLLALVLRLVAINQSLWLDEAIGALAVRDFSYRALIGEFMKFDNHPPLYYLLLKAWTSVFGYSEISLRAPSVIFGVLTILVTYLISLKIFKNKSYALLCASLLAASQFHIYYSQEARMYSMATFFASLAVLFYLELLGNQSKLLFWFLFSLSITLLVFTDYMPIFLIPVFWITSFFLRMDKKWWIKFLPTHLPIVILGFFWLPIFLAQSQGGKWLLTILPSWKEVAGGATFKQAALVWMKFVFGRISLAQKDLYYFLVFLASIPYLVSFYRLVKKVKYVSKIVVFWLAVPLVLGFMISFFFPAFNYFRFLYVYPAFIILTFLGMSMIRQKKLLRITLCLILFFNTISFLIYTLDKKQQREEWRQATKFVEDNAGPNDIALFEYPEPFTPFRWYTRGKISAYGALDSISANENLSYQKAKKILSDARGVYYFEYLRELSDPKDILRGVMEELGFRTSAVFDFRGVGLVYYYTR